MCHSTGPIRFEIKMEQVYHGTSLHWYQFEMEHVNFCGENLISQWKKFTTVRVAHFGNCLLTILKIFKWDVDDILFTENVSRYVVIFNARYFLIPSKIYFSICEKVI